jgi:hypothetical protein
MNDSPFGHDFADSRDRFVKSARDAGARTESYSYPERGPLGEALSTEVAWIGPSDATNVLVMVSGTHGVEGFCGSGAQVDWLRRGEAKRLSKNSAAMLVHALNPYGFAWLRRVTHENVDLNRNWVDFSQPLARRLAYDEIAASLCPSQWDDDSRARNMHSLQGFIAKWGFPAFVEAVSGGQYHHPDGLFFGGTEPTVARRTFESIFSDFLSRAHHIGIIDYHSGLGPLGFGELMTSASTDSEEYTRAKSWYGTCVTPVGSRESASATIGGDWIGAASRLLPHATVTAIAIEFGTVAPLEVLDALRADNWLHRHADASKSWPGRIKNAMRDAFYVDSDVWRGMVLGQSLRVCRHAIGGLEA